MKLVSCRVKTVTKMSENVANGILSGVVKVSGFFTSSVVNSKVGKKFFGLLPGEIVLATLDGFGTLIPLFGSCSRYVTHVFGWALKLIFIRNFINSSYIMHSLRRYLIK